MPAGANAIVNRASLLDLLQLVAGVLKARPPKPIFGCVRIVAADRSIALTGTNLAAWVSSRTAEAEIAQPFDTAVRCDRLLDVIRTMSDHTVSLALNGTQLEVRGSGARFTLPALNPGEFPPVPVTTVEHAVTIPASEFSRLTRQAVVAVAKETQRYAINGVDVVITGNGRVEFVATDGRRVALASTTCDRKVKRFSAIVPPDALHLAVQSAADDGDITFGVSGNQVVIDAGDTRVIATMIEGQFPPYEDIIPKNADKVATVDRAAAIDVVKQAGVISAGAEESSHKLKVTFNAAGMSLIARNGDEEADVRLPCKFEGADIEIGLNAKYLSEGMGVMVAEELAIELTNYNRPICVRDGSDFLLVIMPINLT